MREATLSKVPGRMSSSQLSELALDAAIQVDEVIRGRSDRLDRVQQLMNTLLATMTDVRSDAPSQLDLALLPIYESAFDTPTSIPKKVGDFRSSVHEILANFLRADASQGHEFLARLRDFCVTVHDQSLSQRIDLMWASNYHDGLAIRAY